MRRIEARAPGSPVDAGAGVAVFHQVAVPAQRGIPADEEPKSAQRCVRQRLEEHRVQCPILGPLSWAWVAELSLRDGELVA
jgi:hypothetical protein